MNIDLLHYEVEILANWHREQQACAIGEDIAYHKRQADKLFAFLDTHGKKHSCHAYRVNDQMLCSCGVQWDVNDPEPPICAKKNKGRIDYLKAIKRMFGVGTGS